MRPLVEKLFREGLDGSALAERIRTDVSLSEPQRHVALNFLMQRCSLIRKQALSLPPDTVEEEHESDE
jgi:hypothetical protein